LGLFYSFSNGVSLICGRGLICSQISKLGLEETDCEGGRWMEFV